MVRGVEQRTAAGFQGFSDLLEANFKSHDKRVSALAKAFYHAALSSRTFSWMGLFETKDELQRPRFVIYLANGRGTSTEAGNLQGIDISPTLTQLSLALLPRVFLDLYHMPPEENDHMAQKAFEDLKLRYKTNGDNTKLLWEEHMPSKPQT